MSLSCFRLSSVSIFCDKILSWLHEYWFYTFSCEYLLIRVVGLPKNEAWSRGIEYGFKKNQEIN